MVGLKMKTRKNNQNNEKIKAISWIVLSILAFLLFLAAVYWRLSAFGTIDLRTVVISGFFVAIVFVLFLLRNIMAKKLKIDVTREISVKRRIISQLVLVVILFLIFLAAAYWRLSAFGKIDLRTVLTWGFVVAILFVLVLLRNKLKEAGS
jgi:hypothetical protein